MYPIRHTSCQNVNVLNFLAKKGHLPLLKALIERLENKNPADDNGVSPLYSAAEHGQLEIVKFLVPKLTNKNPKTGKKELYRSNKYFTWKQMTPLHVAAYNGQTDVVKYLVSVMPKNSEVNPVQSVGLTVKDMASLNGHTDIIDFYKSVLMGQCRCLLLGSSESGKSTFVKHFLLQKNNMEEYWQASLDNCKQQAAVNIHSAINTLCEQLSTKELESMGKNPELLNAMDRVQMIKTISPDALFENADDIKALWECNGIQACYNRRNEFQFEDNYFASNFVSQVHKFMDTSYLLTDEDIQTIYPDRWTGIKVCSGIVKNVTLVSEDEWVQF